MSPDLLYDGTDFYEFDAPRIDTGNDHGAGDTLAAATACALAHGLPRARRGRVRQALGHRMHPRRLPARATATARFPRSSGCRMDLDAIAGVAHEPAGAPAGVVVLTHGAGGSRDSPMLIRICDEWARRGWLAVRYNLPVPAAPAQGPALGFGHRRPSRRRRGDRAGPRTGRRTDRPVIAGGHSYGGRMTSMVAVPTTAGRRSRCSPIRCIRREAGTCPHRAPAAHHRADGVHPRHRGPVRQHRRDSAQPPPSSPPPPRSSRSPAPAMIWVPRSSTFPRSPSTRRCDCSTRRRQHPLSTGFAGPSGVPCCDLHRHPRPAADQLSQKLIPRYRPTMTSEHIRRVIVGAGFGGIGAAIQLKTAGLRRTS